MTAGPPNGSPHWTGHAHVAGMTGGNGIDSVDRARCASKLFLVDPDGVRVGPRVQNLGQK